MTRTLLPVFVLAVVAVRPALAAQAPDPVRLRDELRALGQLLGQSVEQVSPPNPGLVLAGTSSCRGYLLKGYGVVFVVPPRRLPVPPVTLARLRRSASRRRPWPDELVVVSGTGRRDPGLKELEAQVEAFQREAALHRAEAERAFDEMTRTLWARLAEAERNAVAGVPPAPPEPALPDPVPRPALSEEPVPVPPPASSPEVPFLPAAPRNVAAPPSPSPAPVPPAAPWVFWSEEGMDSGDSRAPERLVADVHEAVVAALEAHAPLLGSLRPEEVVSVVVDFVAGTPFLDEDARPRRSLSLKVKKRDLDDRSAGRLSAEELRRRVEAVEY